MPILLRFEHAIREFFRKLYRVFLPCSASLHPCTLGRLRLAKTLLEEFADCFGQQFEIVFHVSATIIFYGGVRRGGIRAKVCSPHRSFAARSRHAGRAAWSECLFALVLV